ncbi:MAG: agmatine deiminase family protein [Dysgonamonadaceae bacterium]|jgi:agmatine/peptidylarginine deiminase|nr:agmatine deiminase family protein [Dysgonamonadaceae bacterium]
MKQNSNYIKLPAEWEPQSAVLLTWPHSNTDWASALDEVILCYTAIAKEIIKRERLVIVCPCIEEVKTMLGDVNYSRIIFREFRSNDTWARDHGPVSVLVGDNPYILDFTFNGWGLKFPANYDNQITSQLYRSGLFGSAVGYQNMMHLVLEGGSIESDGEGILMTTSKCLLSPNRNEYQDEAEVEYYMKRIFNIQKILWLRNGYLAGDDTDSHIDTLARFCNKETIVYVKCTDTNDEHFTELALMEKEIKRFRTLEGKPYHLIELPMAEAVYWEGERLPATYANFLIINDAILMPVYNSGSDEIAKTALQKAFPDREIVGINCLPLIKQHGSLHCVTMQFPERFF